MSDNWSVSKEFIESDINAVVVTNYANSPLTTPIASGYALSIALKVAEENPSRPFISVRMNQIGSTYEGSLDESDIELVNAWVTSYSVGRRSGSREYSSALIYIERFDLITPELVAHLAQAKKIGITATVFGGVDSSTAPNKKNLESFSRIKLINLGESGVTVAEQKLASHQR